MDREARRRGLHDADERVVVSDGAEWIRGTCEAIFGGRKVTVVLDMFHCLESAAAVKALCPTGAARDRRFAEVRADIMEGRDAKVVRAVLPRNMERMRYDEYRARGIQVGSGVVESGCRTFGLRLKRPGNR